MTSILSSPIVHVLGFLVLVVMLWRLRARLDDLPMDVKVRLQLNEETDARHAAAIRDAVQQRTIVLTRDLSRFHNARKHEHERLIQELEARAAAAEARYREALKQGGRLDGEAPPAILDPARASVRPAALGDEGEEGAEAAFTSYDLGALARNAQAEVRRAQEERAVQREAEAAEARAARGEDAPPSGGARG